MSYAVRNDGKGWRAVGCENDCTAEETWQADQPAIIVDPNESVRKAIAAKEKLFTTTMQMRVSLGDSAAVSETAALLADIDALKAQLVP